MKVIKEFRPEGWPELKEEIMAEVRKRAGNDKDAEAVAESIFEMGGSGMLKLLRTRCGHPAVCAMGQVAILTGKPAPQGLVLPGREPPALAINTHLTYKEEKKWNGRGTIFFLPDDDKVSL